ncbi:MAG: transglutaminase family protein [Paracoccaceae bacterium]|nr:MAG: transglutaminase family protein [Paracoccaceae bacterium]
MIYDLTARIRYDYHPPAAAGRNLLRLMPADLPGRQRLVAGQISARPAAAERADRVDFFGTRVTEMVHRTPAAFTEFVLRARVERFDDRAGLNLSPPLHELAVDIAADRSLSGDAPHHFLGPSPRVPSSEPISAFAAETVSPDATARDAVAEFGRAIHEAMAFDPAATTVDTAPEEAFAQRRGVCQDFAHVMIAGLRSLGVPAGYVSGFLRTVPPPGQSRLEGADAMHAWVRAWCGAETGWIEYDPTNACAAGDGHVIVGYGRDYDDVAPVHGVLRLSGGRTSIQKVDTRPLRG